MKNIGIIFMICIVFQGCNFASKTTVKKGTKPAIKEVAKLSSKITGKNTAKLAIKDLPKGRKTLSVVKDENGRFIPSINNINEHSSLYTNAVNRALLVKRRAAISPFDQFPSFSQLRLYDSKKLVLVDRPNAEILRKNMYLAMDNNSVNINKGFGGTIAHHVINGSDEAAELSRKILPKDGININAPENGKLLPKGDNSIYKGIVYQMECTPEYSEYVYNKIKDVSSKDDLIATLIEIKHELYTGKLGLQGPTQVIKRGTAQQISRTPIDQGIKISEASSSRLVNIGTKKNIPIEKVIPYGNGGINAEKRTLLEICKNPVPSHLLKNIDNLGIEKKTLARIKNDVSKMGASTIPNPSHNGHVDLSSVAWKGINPKLPNKAELINAIMRKKRSIALKDITPDDIREVSYTIARQSLAKKYGITQEQAGLIIGKLDLVIHEAESGVVEIVPNNVHRFKQLYAHKGYVSKMMKEINGKIVDD